MRWLVVLGVLGCGGNPPPARPPASPPIAAPAPDAAVVADPEPGPTGDPRAFGALTFERRHLKDGDDTTDTHVDNAVRAAVKTCFDRIPLDQRSPSHVYKVVLQWRNDLYEHKVPSPSGVGRDRFDELGGVGDYPPTIEHAEFTTCVKAAVPPERVSSLDADRANTSAIRFTVLAYTQGAVGRYLTGSIGHGQGRP